MIMVVDYGLGNVRAITNIYRKLKIGVSPADSEGRLRKADKIVLPGVGSFDWAMRRLAGSGMMGRLHDMVLGEGVPVLGICVGMQIMGGGSDEGRERGLGWIDAEAKSMKDAPARRSARIPHMGWNDVVPKREGGLFRRLERPRCYFLHSYAMRVKDEEAVLATTDYHGEFPSAIAHGNVLGVQFHPEKSHDWGVEILKNFAGL